jgi:5-methylcytosine-specific restriction endonuclease McrA
MKDKMAYKYTQKTDDKLKVNFFRRKQKGLNRFIDFEEFKNWYDSKEKKCHYCGLKEEECQEIVVTGILKSNRFPQNGVLGRGQSRGMWLEIDRLLPKSNYSLDNCVLCCYFCNNDKSDVFNANEYIEFRNNRVGYLRNLLNIKQDKI